MRATALGGKPNLGLAISSRLSTRTEGFPPLTGPVIGDDGRIFLFGDRGSAAAVDRDVDAVDEARTRIGEEGDGMGDVGGIADPAGEV